VHIDAGNDDGCLDDDCSVDSSASFFVHNQEVLSFEEVRTDAGDDDGFPEGDISVNTLASFLIRIKRFFDLKKCTSTPATTTAA